jgi:hypothetical protein
MKRKRWYILAAIILACVAMARPSAPNVDPRLFGDWQRGSFVQRFNPDGTFERGGPFPMTGVWSVEGRVLVLGKPRTIGSEVRAWLNWFTRQSLTLTPPRYEIVEVTADSLGLRPIRPRPMMVETYSRPSDASNRRKVSP